MPVADDFQRAALHRELLADRAQFTFLCFRRGPGAIVGHGQVEPPGAMRTGDQDVPARRLGDRMSNELGDDTLEAEGIATHFQSGLAREIEPHMAPRICQAHVGQNRANELFSDRVTWSRLIRARLRAELRPGKLAFILAAGTQRSLKRHPQPSQ